jgi:hypothetical protein
MVGASIEPNLLDLDRQVKRTDRLSKLRVGRDDGLKARIQKRGME